MTVLGANGTPAVFVGQTPVDIGNANWVAELWAARPVSGYGVCGPHIHSRPFGAPTLPRSPSRQFVGCGADGVVSFEPVGCGFSSTEGLWRSW